MAEPRSLLIIRNPVSRTVPAEVALRDAARPLEAGGWTIELRTTRAPGEATELARAAAGEGVAVVAACGGDGTIHEVVNGLAGSSTALGVVPGGTANVWAREAGVPRDAGAALRALAEARAVRLDTGLAGDEHFLLMCSAGLDVAALRDVDAGGRKPRLGRAAFALPALRHLAGWGPVHGRLTIDGEVLERDLLMVVAGNTRLYGGVLRLTGAARADDGWLDVCVFSAGGRGGRWRRLRLAARAGRGGLDRARGRGIDYRRGTLIELETERPIPIQADGEYIAETPLRLSVAPRSLTALVAQARNPLLRDG